MKRQHIARAIGLIPNRISGGKSDWSRIAESPHTPQRAIVMVKRTVLLHQEDNMFDVSDRAVMAMSGNI